MVVRILLAFASGKFFTNALGRVSTKSVDYLNSGGLRSQRSFHSLYRGYAFADDLGRVAK
jgi:hypothetical protein